MPKYRKRPIVVEAEQWHPGHPVPGVYYEDREDDIGEGLPGRDMIDTLEGPLHVSPGDWIITGVARSIPASRTFSRRPTSQLMISSQQLASIAADIRILKRLYSAEEHPKMWAILCNVETEIAATIQDQRMRLVRHCKVAIADYKKSQEVPTDATQ